MQASQGIRRGNPPAMRKARVLARAAAIILAAAAAVPSLAGEHGERHHEHHEDAYREGHGLVAVASNKTWAAECGACHVAYAPGLLPERSWRAIMDGLERHFGENAGLDPATRKTIADFLVANAADRGDARSRRRAAVPSTATPLRITELDWFQREHDEIRPDVWRRKEVGSRANCGACHPGAEGGRFNEHDAVVPGGTGRRG
ncbi:MAG TPA: diheme cytochrome c [Rhodocyclaceae bacterium]